MRRLRATTSSGSRPRCATCSRVQAGRADGRAATCRSGSRRTRPPELLHFRSLLDDYEHRELLRVVLSRAARSARLTTHFDLDFPRSPRREPYWCHKHRRTCTPVGGPRRFVDRYLSTPSSGSRRSEGSGRRRAAAVVHGVAGDTQLEDRFDAILTSPPYPGLIDYHEQHRYAYELLGLDDRRRARARRRCARDEPARRSTSTSTGSCACSGRSPRSLLPTRP